MATKEKMIFSQCNNFLNYLDGIEKIKQNLSVKTLVTYEL